MGNRIKRQLKRHGQKPPPLMPVKTIASQSRPTEHDEISLDQLKAIIERARQEPLNERNGQLLLSVCETLAMRKGAMLRSARRRVQGHLNYYAITDNSDRCYYYVHCTKRILFKWLNRKSQRRAYTWAGFHQALAYIGWPRPRIRKDLDPCQRAELY